MHTVELCTQDNEHQVRCNYLPASAALRLTAKTNSGQITDTRLALWLLLVALSCRTSADKLARVEVVASWTRKLWVNWKKIRRSMEAG